MTDTSSEALVEAVARAMKPDLFVDCQPGPAVQYERDFTRGMARRAIAAMPDAGRLAELEAALVAIDQWANAYPKSVFSEPDMEAITKVLTSAGMAHQIDRLHGSWARHLLDGVGNIARAALGAKP